MTSYWDYLKRDISTPISSGPAAFIHALYDKAYDESHGARRYWLSQLRPLSTNRKLRDSAKSAQDRYDNTGTDEQYITGVRGTDATSIAGDVGLGAGVVGMARSLTDMYRPEVIHNCDPPKDPMFG